MERTSQTEMLPPTMAEAFDMEQGKALLKNVCVLAHSAIHDKEIKQITVLGKTYPVEYSANGCRKVNYADKVLFMEQNKDKQSRYAQEAREGKRITWGIRAEGWIYIDDNGPKL